MLKNVANNVNNRVYGQYDNMARPKTNTENSTHTNTHDILKNTVFCVFYSHICMHTFICLCFFV